MFPRYPATRASRSCSSGFRFVANSPRQFRRGTASFTNNKLPTRQSLSSNVSSNSSVPRFEQWQAGKRLASTAAAAAPGEPMETAHQGNRKDEIYGLIDKINETDGELAELMEDLGISNEYFGALSVDGPGLDHAFSQTIGHRDEQALESRVRTARQEYGDELPENHLNATELRLYIQLYGEPIGRAKELEVEEKVDEEPDRLYREDGEGGWEEVEVEPEEGSDEPEVVYDMEVGPPVKETISMQRTREVAEQLGGEIMLEEFQDEAFPDSTPRLHPLTIEGKFATHPKTVNMPRDSMTIPISAVLSNFSNRHIADIAHRTFGGRLLPHSTTTLPPRAQVPQQPIPLQASQRHMGEMEANAYIAALYPGMYASALSTLVEIRKRLGTNWIRCLMTQDGGPNVLDAGGGGAGILAWRDVLRAEWDAMYPDRPNTEPVLLGRSTVVAGSESLQARASLMLEDTTFLPRLPDYVHAREKPTLDDERTPRRKQYDIIIAPHTLMEIDEEYLRKQHVENLWALLNPNGGVLILLEKGRQKGFEAIAGAREMLLNRYISSPGSTEYDNTLDSPDDSTRVQKETGMIIAPCTNHEKCPMYNGPGHNKGRKDYCHFEQRYIRPPFLQRIIGAKDRNHEDVQFSYVAVQRGKDMRQSDGIVQGPQAVEAAFAGYEDLYDMTAEENLPEEDLESAETEPEASAASSAPQDANATATEQTSPGPTEPFHTLSLPRVIYPPLKRRGHVVFDFCTPAGQIERWTVPRSFSRQAYKDARKARWGDLWALGAKTRIPRKVILGDKHGEGKKERLAKRAAAKEAMREEEEGFGEDEDSEQGPSKKLPDLPVPTKKKGVTVPSWKKHADKKTLRQASKKRSIVQLADDNWQ
ncbi:tRNA methyltransferase RSM22 [Aspergillus chevalieri]|uniref:37S ribosomal protein S22 n=1 Tax=Aspergillus chevalieri TaxID=182096 RepID=A0A7R7VIM8_ASPCH|nr:37S ribosomal protein S22 [Aspergillus chevalieri]BCR85408.1 37S ribosomal protein S22 [Aspergillus chevalieri]